MAQPTPTETWHRPSHARIAFATGIGTTIEYYDFLIYAIAASTVFNVVFFANDDPMVGTLMALATFGVGFVARPAGGAIMGHFGDRIGRKFLLVLTIVTMALSTFLIGALPTYAAIGMWAPALLVLLRLLQGLAAGGEWGAAALTAVEHAPRRKRGIYGSWTVLGTSTGALIATAAFALLGFMSEDAFNSWGWRLPFLASIVLLGLGLYVRLGLTETREFLAVRESGTVARMPLKEVVREYPRVLLLTVGTVVGFSTWVYVTFTFVLAYGTEDLGMSRASLLNCAMVAMALQFVTVPLFAALSDRVGRRPVMLAGAGFLTVYAFVFFPLLQTKDPVVVLLALVIAYNATGAIHAPMAGYFCELYEPRVRASGVSLGMQVGHVLGGGLAPALTTWLHTFDHATLPVAIYLSATVAIGLLTVHHLPETAPGRVPTRKTVGVL